MIVQSAITRQDLQRKRLANVCILLTIVVCSLRFIFKTVGLRKMGLNGKRVHLSFTPFVPVVCLSYRHFGEETNFLLLVMSDNKARNMLSHQGTME
jgi:hypothetical protein